MSSPSPQDLGPILRDLDLDEGAAPRIVPPAEAGAAGHALTGEEWLLVAVPGTPAGAELARIREALWPLCHVVGLYRSGTEGLAREGVGGRAKLDDQLTWHGVLLAARPRAHVMSPAMTAAKFDTNAVGWNGVPGSPGYGHFRWMRRFVGTFAPVPDGARVLDFGCGAGWVGIEAAKSARDVELASFDPSPEMVRITGENAAAEGIARFTGRVGFGEDPPFPAAGEEPFDVVISSGVLSFSPDLDRWMEGLIAAVKPGGTLVVGDLNPASRGMQRRRRTHALLPVRELNAQESGEIRRRLEAAGFRHEKTSGYQLTRPVPQAMHVSETRLKGALSPALLLANRVGERALGASAPGLFDSWVMRFGYPRG
ncbi:MAG: methyltransferase domain-containing protein [Planctomycetota bacterium]